MYFTSNRTNNSDYQNNAEYCSLADNDLTQSISICNYMYNCWLVGHFCCSKVHFVRKLIFAHFGIVGWVSRHPKEWDSEMNLQDLWAHHCQKITLSLHLISYTLGLLLKAFASTKLIFSLVIFTFTQVWLLGSFHNTTLGILGDSANFHVPDELYWAILKQVPSYFRWTLQHLCAVKLQECTADYETSPDFLSAWLWGDDDWIWTFGVNLSFKCSPAGWTQCGQAAASVTIWFGFWSGSLVFNMSQGRKLRTQGP